jgi:hypothetical protein
MSAQPDAFQAAVMLLRDLAPYDQCRHIVQMVWDGSLTQQQGKDLLAALVDHEIDTATPPQPRSISVGRISEA